MDDKIVSEIQDIAFLINDEHITNLYKDEYSRIEKIKNRKELVQNKIRTLTQKTCSINNYRTNLKDAVNYYKQIELKLNESFIIYDAQTDKIELEIKKIKNEKSRCQRSLQEYELILSNTLNKLSQINKYIAQFPENKELFAQDLINIDIQINFLQLQISNLTAKINDLNSELLPLQEQKNKRIQKKENIQSYLNDMIENPEKSFLSVNIKQLNHDKEQLSALMNEMEQLNKANLNMHFDAQREFSKIYSGYLKGNFSNEEFANVLVEYQEKINNDKLLLEKEPELARQLNKKIDTLQLKLQPPVVEEEIIDIKPASKGLIDKLKRKKKNIIAFCVSAFLALGIGVSSKMFNDKNNDIVNAGYGISYSGYDLDENVYDSIFNNNNMNIQDELSLPDTIEVKNGSYIYENSYDAINNNNALNPYFGYNQKRNVCGVTIEMPDGSIKTLYKDNKDFYTNYNNLINSGGVLKLYLTGQNNDYEGFYKADDSISTGMRR